MCERVEREEERIESRERKRKNQRKSCFWEGVEGERLEREREKREEKREEKRKKKKRRFLFEVLILFLFDQHLEIQFHSVFLFLNLFFLLLLFFFFFLLLLSSVSCVLFFYLDYFHLKFDSLFRT